MIVPTATAPALCDRLLEAGRGLEIVLAGPDALGHSAFENCAFNPHRRTSLTPIELQLQCRVSYRKDYRGSDALRRRRTEATHRTVAMLADGVRPSDVITYRDRAIGTILWAERSITLDRGIAVGLVERQYAHAGVDWYRVCDKPVRTVSAPFVLGSNAFVAQGRQIG